MTLPLLIAGLVLRLTDGSWFSGQYTVGDILLWAGGIGLVLQLLIIALAAWAASK